jgi:hypothetical protein
MPVQPWEKQISFPELGMRDRFIISMDDDATPLQRRYIALLANRRGIEMPIEEQPMTIRDAIQLILRLKKMGKHV